MNKYACIIVLALTMVVSAAWAQEPSQPLTVEDIIKIALEHNPQLVSSQQNIAVARAGLKQARSSYSPQLTLDASQGARGASGGGVAPDTDGASLILGMTFWRSGRSDSVAQSRASVSAAGASYADQRLSVASLVADDYYAVLAAAELVGVAKAGVVAAEQHRQQVEKQIEQGTVAAVEIHTVDEDLANARLSLIDAQSTVKLTMAALKANMGIPYTTELQLAPSIVGAQGTLPSPAEAVAAAIEKRPDLRAQRATIEGRKAAVRVAKAARGPVVEVGGQAAGSSADWSDSRGSWDLTAGLTWPLADGGYTKAGEDAAKANVISSEADLKSLTDQATQEVQNALIELERAAESIKATEEAVTAATARLNAAEVKYREGLAILIEVTDARQSLTSAQADAVRARFAYQVAEIGLQRAMATLPLPGEEGVAQP
ncbi:MAG: TolC family protein [Armatimonadia bacterium]